MKANEAPEKVYLDSRKAWQKTFYDYFTIKAKKNDIEYTRTDAFIEKALEFLDGCIPDYIDLTHANVDTFINVDNKRFIDEFRKHMEGE